MTNEMAIFMEQMRLMKEGMIKATGRKVLALNAAGEEVLVDEPEAIHTFLHWKELGYCVRKGEKAVTKIVIWKHTQKFDKETGEPGEEKMFPKTAAFFARHQVDRIEVA